MAAGPSDPHTYCRELVRKHDYESFLNSYFYPSNVQRGYFAVKAFSVGNFCSFLNVVGKLKLSATHRLSLQQYKIMSRTQRLGR